MTQDLTQASAAELGRLYAKGKASPVETMKAVLARAGTLATMVNALCHVDAMAALAAARASEKRWKKGEPRSPLDGVPVSIKELVRVKGWPASMGSKLTDKTPVDADAPVVARLREAGAIVFAQSTSSEYGHKGVTDSPLHGITRNPWNPDMTPGGSSGGAGRGRCGRPRPDRHRHRRRRLGAHPRELQRADRPQGPRRPRARLAALDDGRSLQHRPDGAHRARRGP